MARLGHTAVGRFAPPLALMALIFFLSAQPDLNSGLGAIDLVGRKLIHATEFGLLWFLWLRALRHRSPLGALTIAALYAATDEFHQHFVHGRHASPIDWGIDTTGALIAWAIWARLDPAALGRDEDGLRPVDRAQLPVDVVQVGADGGGRE